MNIAKTSNFNFQAKILGKGYNKLKEMSIDNGLSAQEVLAADTRINNAFPADTLNISSSFNSGKALLRISLYKKDTGNSFKNFSVNRNFEIPLNNDEQVKNLFVSLAEKVEEMRRLI